MPSTSIISNFYSSITELILTPNNKSKSIFLTVDISHNVPISSVLISNATLISSNNNNYLFKLFFNYDDYTNQTTNQSIKVSVLDTQNRSETETINISIHKMVYTFNNSFPEFYIEATVNLNQNIFVQNGIPGLHGGSISHENNNYNIKYHLPVGFKSINMMNILAKKDDLLLNQYTYIVDFNISNTGNISVNGNMIGTSTTGHIDNTHGDVNYAYWEGETVPALNDLTPNRLSSILTVNDVIQYKNTEIQQILNTFKNKSTLSSWTIQIDTLQPSIFSDINQFKLFNGKPVNRIFDNNDKIKLATAYNYSFKIKDVNNTEHTIIENTPIFAILTHNDNAPTIL
tara:strand:+ start:33369 stop:34400 length:1032 start_codon:yes stop_codon:yes gene_type:complete